MPRFRLPLRPLALVFAGWAGLSAEAQIAPPQLSLEPVATGFSSPVDIAHAGDERLFIVERGGRIRITDTAGNTLPVPFLDIDDRVRSTGQEQGLLGLAFSPDYATDGRLYVHYTGNDGGTRISRFLVDPADPDRADPATEEVLLTVAQPFTNHNAGDLAFGPDGYLYVTMGDGGSFGDPGNRSQNPGALLGKLLRLDVSGASGYAVPPDNPFAGSADTLPEIWHLGLRNPWRISFDRVTGDLWIADVGQNAWEEVNRQPAASPGGENWGWRCYEGEAPYNTAGCAPFSAYDPPLFTYDHFSGGLSVTGGFVYRGDRQFTLAGMDPVGDFAQYLLADYVTGRWWSLQRDACSGEYVPHALGIVGFDISTFGEDASGELFVANLATGTISRVVDECARRHPRALDFIHDLDPEFAQLEGMPAGDYVWLDPLSPCDTFYVSDEGGLPGSLISYNTDYTVDVRYPDGCALRYTGFLGTTGLEPTDPATAWTLAPQPASGRWTWSAPDGSAGGTLRVLDAAGRAVAERRLRPQGGPVTEAFDASAWPAGLYSVRWTDGRRAAARTLLIQR